MRDPNLRYVDRYFGDISPIFRRHFPIFSYFSSKRFSVAKIASIKADIRYITDISADISEISILGRDNFPHWTHIRSTSGYYSKQWLDESPNCVPPHRDIKVIRERKKKKCFEGYFSNEVDMRRVNEEYAAFFACFEDFSNCDSINDRWYISLVKWRVVHGTYVLMLKSITFKLLEHLFSFLHHFSHFN